MYALVPITWRDRVTTGEEEISNRSSVKSGRAVPCIEYNDDGTRSRSPFRIQLVCTDFLALFSLRMLRAIHRDSRFGQQMVDLNTSLTIIINYRMYPTLFRRKEQT